MPRKVLVAMPASLLEQVDYVAQFEHRTRSDLMREALRRYLERFRRENAGRRSMISTVAPLISVVEASND